MLYNRSGSLIQTERLHPVVENLGTAFIIALSIYTAVPAPKHDENKFALEESSTVTVASNPDVKIDGKRGAMSCGLSDPIQQKACMDVDKLSP